MVIAMQFGPYRIDERVVTFGGATFPPNGHLVVMAGGPGVGKSFIKSQIVLIDGKEFDPDEITALYKSIGKLSAADLKDPELLKQLYANKIKPLNNKRTSLFFSLISNEKKPNIILDSAGRHLESTVLPVLPVLRQSGYKTTLVFVHANMDIAWARNIKRERTVPKDVFDQIHKDAANAINKYKSYFDYIWSVDNSSSEKQWWIKYPELVQRIK